MGGGGTRHGGVFRRTLRGFVRRSARSGHEAFQARFLVGSSMLGILVAVPSLALEAHSNRAISVLMLACFIGALLVQLGAMWLGASTRALTWTLLGSVCLFIVGACLVSRELDPAQLPWLILIPLAARVLNAPRADERQARSSIGVTLVAAGLAATAGALVVAAKHFGLTFDQPYVPDPPWLVVTNYLLFLASAFGLVVLYELSVHEMASELQHVRDVLSICAWCKKIRMDDAWVPLERYVTHQSKRDLTHGICPTCEESQFPED